MPRRKTSEPPSIKAVATRQGAQARAMERGLNQYLLAQLETALKLLTAKEEIIRRMEDGERRYRCYGCHTTVWANWAGPPDGWQLFEAAGEPAYYCHQCARPRRAEFSPRAAALVGNG